MASRSTHLPSASAVPRSPPNHPRPGSPTGSSGRCSPPPGNRRTRATSRWWPCSACWACGSSRPLERTSQIPAKSTATGCCACAARAPKAVLVPLPPAVGRATDRATGSRTRGPVLLNSRGARMDRHAATGHLHQLAEAAGIQVTRAYPHMLRHTVATRLDAGVDLRDAQIAARHADPRTTMRYERADQPGPARHLHPRGLHGLWHLVQPASPGLKLRETPCIAEMSRFPLRFSWTAFVGGKLEAGAAQYRQMHERQIRERGAGCAFPLRASGRAGKGSAPFVIMSLC